MITQGSCIDCYFFFQNMLKWVSKDVVQTANYFTFFVIPNIFWLQEKELLELVAKELGSPSSNMRNQETRTVEDGDTGSNDVLDGMTLSETSDDDRVETSLDKSKDLDTGSTNTSIDSDEIKVRKSNQFYLNQSIS